ncbi:MAG: hypothetical protein QM691_06300 [Opitutaceae bacterium]
MNKYGLQALLAICVGGICVLVGVFSDQHGAIRGQIVEPFQFGAAGVFAIILGALALFAGAVRK